METPQNFGQLGKPIPGNDPVKVADTSQAPYHFTGLLKITFPNDKTYTGTGILIAEPGKVESSYVLTCAHNLYNVIDGGKVMRVTFTRAYNDSSSPYSTIEGIEFLYPVGYPDLAISRQTDSSLLGTSANIDLDYGLIKLKTPVRLDGLPELEVKQADELNNMPVQLNGYGWFDEQMSHATGKLTQSAPTALFYPISTKAGASGTAIMATDNKTIVGIHTRVVSRDMLNQGIRITESVFQQIREWMER